MAKPVKDNRRVVHLAIRYPNQRVGELSESPSLQGIIYDPQRVYAPQSRRSARSHFEDFFRIGREYSLVTINTAMSPMELANHLQEDYKVSLGLHVCGVLSRFRTSKKQSSKLLRDLWADPYLYSRDALES